jgi:hypothetical protein
MNGISIVDGGPWAKPSAKIRHWNGLEGRVTSPMQTLEVDPPGTPLLTPHAHLRMQSGRLDELIAPSVMLFGDGEYVFEAWCFANQVPPTDITQQILACQLCIASGEIVKAPHAHA